MIRRLLTASVLATAGVMAATPAFAQEVGTTDVPFNATVEAFCEFGEVTPGEMVVNEAGTALSSVEGTSGIAPLTCNSGSTVAAGDVVEDPANPATFTGFTVTLSDGNNQTTQDLTIDDPVTDQDITVDLETAESEVPVPAGDYTLTVPLTATPN